MVVEIPVYGEPENSSCNGHFESACCHPRSLFNREGDCLAAKLRPGNVHSAEGWEDMPLPEISEAREERGVKYAIRIPANGNLARDVAELLTRPVGRPSCKLVVWYKSFLYRAASWKTARRVVAKLEFHEAVDQGRQAGGEDDPAELGRPPGPVPL